MASSSSSHVKHEVFISFRGTDTRRALVSHLKRALCQKGIDVFVDDKLQRGDGISSALLQAIEVSQISLIIFSKDYASSKWCLEELRKVIECKERNNQTVIPVFYYVNPRDVRHQSGTYEQAFAKHEYEFKNNKFKVQNWKSALRKSADLFGFHYPSQFEDEADMIQAIVKVVLGKLNTTYPSKPLKGLVGIHQNLACLESLMNINSGEVRILGIWGMPGIGTDAIEGIMLDMSQITDLHLSADTLTKLRFLKFYSGVLGKKLSVHVPPDFELFSEKVSYFEWSGYPSESLPSNFSASMLVEIHMPEPS